MTNIILQKLTQACFLSIEVEMWQIRQNISKNIQRDLSALVSVSGSF